MDLRKKIRTSSYHQIAIPIGESYTVDDENGNDKIEYYESDQYTLADILSRVEAAGIPSSEFNRVHVYIGYERRSDPALKVEYRKVKTQKEVDNELESMQKEYEKKRKEKELSRQKKLEKKLEKEKTIASLTPEQRKILGIKPGYAGRDEIGGSDF